MKEVKSIEELEQLLDIGLPPLNPGESFELELEPVMGLLSMIITKDKSDFFSVKLIENEGQNKLIRKLK